MPHALDHQHGGGSQSYEMERKYSVPSNPDSRTHLFSGAASEDLHAWSIYRQNLNSDFTDSALGSTDKSPLPYGNFQLRDTTVQSILSHPRYGPKSALGSNMYTYLKFGLPRVFPPNHNGSNRSATPQHFNRVSSTRPHYSRPKGPNRGPRDGSSGYDSSDNETTQQQYKQNRKYRSDPDFRMQNVHPSYHQTHHQHGGQPPTLMHAQRPPNQWTKNKSISEANLLAPDMYSRNPYQPNNRRNSIADFGHDVVDHSMMSQLGRPMSKAESHLSVPHSRRGPAVIRRDFVSQEQDIVPTFAYPHLQARALEISSPTNKRMLLLQNVSFEIRGGEIMAVMATNENEGTGLLNVLSGLRSPVGGDVILNGQNVSNKALRSRVAYVQNDSHLCEEMTAQQTLRFNYDLKAPTDKLGHLKIDPVDRINVLIEDLGLEQVRNTKVAHMTTSEKRRLNVACHLLLDTDIVVLDLPTRGMDIFDTFFLVEYLRQWANGGSGHALGRIVILTLHPPTYEIFTMLSRVLLISAGRTMYSGRRKDMLPYFTMVEYPCPSFKNPSDYYLDLVTLDDLSAEAMLESSQRIEQLADIFRRKQEPLSDPGPPTTLPMTVKNANCFKQTLVLFTKFQFYTQPNTFVRWLSLFFISALLSLVIGAVFWDVPNTDPQLVMNDRFGYHYTVLCVTLWPILLSLTLKEYKDTYATVERDINDGLYNRFVYIFTKTIVNLFPSLFIWLVFLVPSYSLSGLYMQGPANYNGFYIYIGYMLLYLSCLQIGLMAFIYLIPCPNTAIILASILYTAFFLNCGYTLHYRDFTVYTTWLRYISPTTWLLPVLSNREYSQEAISSSVVTTLCRNKQIQHHDIIVQLPCPPANGTQVLQTYGFLPEQSTYFNHSFTVIALVAFYLICFVASCAFFAISCGRKNRRTNLHVTNDANKP